ncbi:MAG TPA: efflux RND transporter permease subunit [Verrucomicrobiae bacterium]|nr:efflux RND transporter permease subunit [Verrucomicrobiae bacterium]
MNLPELCIKRPVFATVLSLVIVLIGLVSFQRLSVREYPNVDKPVVTVNTTYPGASAQIVESQVTQVLEDALAGLEGVDFTSSISREQASQISVTFHLSRDPESAASDVRDRVAQGRGQLPAEVLEPVVQKAEADAQPIIFVPILSDRHNRLQLFDYADRNVKDRLQSLPGVAFVRMFGSRYTMRLWLDPERLAAYGLTPQDIEDALRRQNVELPAGRVESAAREFTVLSETDLRTAEDFNNLIIRQAGGFLVRLSDIGHAELGAGNERFATRFKGQDAVAMAIIKQSAANPLEVSRAVRAEMAKIAPTLPEGMRLDLAYDAGVFIKSSIDNVFATILEAVVLVVLIIFVFLRTFRATLIPLVTIPVSLLGACALMVAFGFTINTLTLLAAVLAVGLVVDDAIVMLENVHRHIEAGEPPRQAARVGSREIGFAIIAMTLTLASVYAPVGFQPGTTGKLFTEFAWTLAGAVLVSGFVALTLTPMMCSVLLKPHTERHSRFYDAIGRGLDRITNGYRGALRATLDRRAIALVIGAVAAIGGAWLFTQLKQELSPTEDRGFIFGVFIAPEGSTLAYTDGYARKLEAIFAATPDISKYFVVTGFPGVTTGAAFIRLHDWGERRPVFAVQKELQPKMFAGAPGVLAFPTLPPSLGATPFDQPVQVVVRTHLPFQELAPAMDRIARRAGEIAGLVNVDTDLKLNKPQLRVEVNRDKAAAMGVDTLVIGRALETMLGGRQVTRFKRDGEQYDVLVQLPRIDRSNPRDLNRIYVRGSTGTIVGLANVVSLSESVAPKELNHFNQLRAATLKANLAGALTQGEALDAVEGVIHAELPDAQVEFSGPAREYKRSQQGMVFILLLSLLFIYLVLAAQFESFIDPLIIMLTVPFAMAGAFLALQLSGNTWNIYSQVGIVTLIGLITKHGILIVEFANQRQQAGRSKLDAVVEAATLRLRPILMTTGAMVLGAVPLAMATGAGAESREVIGMTIVGGLLVGTLFTLFVIPVVYVLLARRHVADEATPEALPAR